MKIVSGIRPTGNIHLGNYLGAIKQWKELQKEYECVFFIADLHSEEFVDKVIPYKILQQCGWLNRMTQFKDKSQTEEATLALLSYPVLMAADIFYFGGTHIPIGGDQKQHIEFVRDLAQRTRHTMPEPIIGEYPRIMSLTDGTKKMSKSDPNDMSRINLSDKPDVIRQKIMAAKSASTFNDDTPEMNNLKTIYKACGGELVKGAFFRIKDFKGELAELIIKEITSV